MTERQQIPYSTAEIDAEVLRRSSERLTNIFTDDGKTARELYPKHLGFFEAGAAHRERLLLGGNRVGKTEAGSYEVTLHLTGMYPDWWVGKRFDKAIECWVVGENARKTREVVQAKLMGRMGPIEGEKIESYAASKEAKGIGTGMIPGGLIRHWSMRHGVTDAVDMAWVKSRFGGDSHITFKSYEMGRDGFSGDAIDLIWLDEEPPQEIYAECLLRTMTTNGIVIVTATPLDGLTDFIASFLDPETVREQLEPTGDRSKFTGGR